MHPAIGKHPAIENLRNSQRQLDADGCEVGVSRQAVDETLAVSDQLADALMDMLVACDPSICSGAMLLAYHKGMAAMKLRRGEA